MRRWGGILILLLVAFSAYCGAKAAYYQRQVEALQQAIEGAYAADSVYIGGKLLLLGNGIRAPEEPTP